MREVSVAGLKVDLSLEHVDAHFDPDPIDGELFDTGDVITAASPGGPPLTTWPAFEVTVSAPDGLQTDLVCPVTLMPDQDLVVEWTAAQVRGAKMARAVLDIPGDRSAESGNGSEP